MTNLRFGRGLSLSGCATGLPRAGGALAGGARAGGARAAADPGLHAAAALPLGGFARAPPAAALAAGFLALENVHASFADSSSPLDSSELDSLLLDCSLDWSLDLSSLDLSLDLSLSLASSELSGRFRSSESRAAFLSALRGLPLCLGLRRLLVAIASLALGTIALRRRFNSQRINACRQRRKTPCKARACHSTACCWVAKNPTSGRMRPDHVSQEIILRA
eukprot:1543358-Pleurochrysis_carterae.AAC.2